MPNIQLHFQSHQAKIYSVDDVAYINEERQLGSNGTPPDVKELANNERFSILSKPYENLILFTGAGSSISSGGKRMSDLWDAVQTEITESILKKIYSLVNLPYPESEHEKDLELLLSQIFKAKEILPPHQDEVDLDENIKKINKKIVDLCRIPLKKTSPHIELLNKMTARKTKYSRLKIFTLNYDTLFEQAASQGNFTIIDGFSFSADRFFNPNYFDYDLVVREKTRIDSEVNFIPKLFHLYKPHGSVNWMQKDEKISINNETNSPLIIYPNANKYEHSYEQPFFEMTARFQKCIKQQNTLLICVGFSFNDKHFTNSIKEAVMSNPYLSLFIIQQNFEKKTSLNDFLNLVKSHNNIFFLSETFDEFASNYPFPEEYKDFIEKND